MELVRAAPPQTPDPRVALGPGAGDLSRVWFSLEGAPWRALLLVPARAGADLSPVAASLLDVAVRASPRAPQLIDARRMGPAEVRLRLEDLDAAARDDHRAIVLIDNPLASPPAQAVARRCDAALLCVELGEATLDTAQATLEL